jgi:hypothetical protein
MEGRGKGRRKMQVNYEGSFTRLSFPVWEIENFCRLIFIA